MEDQSLAGLLDTGKRSKPGRSSAAAAAYTAQSTQHSTAEHTTQHSTQHTTNTSDQIFTRFTVCPVPPVKSIWGTIWHLVYEGREGTKGGGGLIRDV